MNEFELINYLTHNIKYNDKNILVGIGDDAAVIKYNQKKYLLYTTDSLVENIHFNLKWKINKKKLLYFIGWKAVASNVSDILAMGGIPKYILISLNIPEHLKTQEIKIVYKGLMECANNYNISNIGGNITKSEKFIISITLIGEVLKKNLLLRSSAFAGDYIYTEEGVGKSAKGFYKLINGAKKIDNDILYHLKPTPSIKWNKLLNKYKINSAIDISDGFIADLNHILEKSKKGAEIYIDNIPSDEVENFLYGGEDYKIIFTSPDDIYEKGIIKIGKIIKNKKIYLIKENKKIILKKIKGFRHF